MDPYRFRIPAKVISIVCLVIFSLAAVSVLAVVAVASLATTISSTAPESPEMKKEVAELDEIFVALYGSTLREFSIFLWILIAILAICIVFQFAGAIKLFQASRLNADPEIALGQATYWFIVFSFFTFLEAVQDIYSLAWGKLITVLIVDGVCIYIVWKFIQELKAAIGRNIPKV